MKKILQLFLSLLISITALNAHSDAFKPAFVDTLIDPYLIIQKGLAGDDLKVAQTGANALLKALESAPHGEGAHEEAMDLMKPAKAILETQEIKSARTNFLSLSQEMTTLITHVGVSSEKPLYIAFCPMAFDNKGGVWIQEDKTVANPYYGSMMLRCGSIQKQIAGSEKHDAPMEAHSGHAH